MGSKLSTLSSTTILGILFAANVYDPSGAFRVKYIAGFLLAYFSAWTLKHLNLSTFEAAAGSLLFVAWPLWSLLYGTLRKGDVRVGLTEVTPFLFILPLASVLSCNDRRKPLRLYYLCLFSLAIFVTVAFGLVFLMPDSAIGSRLFGLLSSLHEKEGFFGTKALGETQVPSIYFGSTLFLVPTSVYFLFAGKMVRAVVAFLALALAFSKAGTTIVIAFGLVYSVTYLLSSRHSQAMDRASKRSSLHLRATLPFLLLAGLACTVLLAFPGFSEEIADTLTTESASAQVRIGHFDSLMKLFAENPHYLLVGQGVGLPFYTSGESEFVQNIEIDHLNTIRKFGFPWFIGFTAVVFYSSWKLIRSKDREDGAFGFALMSMYLAAGTNPVLLSPLFIMLMMLSYFAQRGLTEGLGNNGISFGAKASLLPPSV
jgi:hypothetical protein